MKFVYSMLIKKATSALVLSLLMSFGLIAQVPVEQRQALIDFYNATDGPNWTNNTNWNTDTPVNTWHGAIVINNTVLFLYLGNNNLSGTIPASIGNLSGLESLDVSNNNLDGNLPAELFAIPSLGDINVSKNSLFGKLEEFSSQSMALVDISENNFVFSDLEPVFDLYSTKFGTSFKYLDQKTIGSGGNIDVEKDGRYLLELSDRLINPNNEYKWFKDNVLIENANESSYNLMNTEEVGFFSHYRAEVHNNSMPLLVLKSETTVVRTIAPPCIAVSDQEKQALLDLYTQTGGINWSNTTRAESVWDEATPVCDWYGVTVIDGKVTKLELPNNGLVGRIPESVNNLRFLEVLDLGTNQLQEEIASNISGLENLTILLLNNNSFTGSIPVGFGSLKKLVKLDLSRNQLNGEIPISFCNLVNLEELNLADNQFSGVLIPEFGFLKKLRRFDVRNNQFVGTIPTAFTGMPQLEFFALSNNGFYGALPANLSSLQNISEVLLENNAFIFSDFEKQHKALKDKLTTYVYSPQQDVDLTETKSVLVGSSITLGTKLSSENNSYIWFKNGEEIQEVTGNTLTISPATPEDAGEYYFTATNDTINNLTLTRNKIRLEVKESCEVSATERAALVDLFNATGGTLWTNTVLNNQAWNTIDPNSKVCDWYGITVVNDKVTRIDLSDNNLIGSLPESLVNLLSLETLILSKNQLQGNIPVGIALLTNLKELRIDENKYIFSNFGDTYTNVFWEDLESYAYDNQDKVDEELTTVVFGEDYAPDGDPSRNITLTSDVLVNESNEYQWYKDGFPIETEAGKRKEYVIVNAVDSDAGMYVLIVTNPNLNNLQISRYVIKLLVRSQTIGPCINKEDQRDILIDLYNATNGDNWKNTTEGNKPWDVTNPDSDICQWYGVRIDSFGNVFNINLRSNNLSGDIPETIGNLSELSFLDLSDNNLKNQLPVSIGNLRSIAYLFLSENEFSGSIPETIGQLKKLKELTLNSNKFTSIPSQIGQLQSLKNLNLAENNINAVPVEIGQLSNLEILRLGDNLFTSLPNTFGGLINLKELILFGVSEEQNFIDEIPASFGQLKKLEKLILRNFRGAIPLELGNLTNLKDLSISGGEFEGGIPPELGNLENLEILRIERCQNLGKIPPSIGRLSKLKTLILRNNNLEGYIPAELGNLLELDSFWLDDNSLAGAIPETIGSLVKLRSLSIGNNKLTGTIPESIGLLINLESIYLSNNKLTGVIPSSISLLTKLTSLSLQGNELSGQIPEEIGLLKSLVSLRLTQNKFTEAIPESILNLSALKFLHLDDNEFIFSDFTPWFQTMKSRIGTDLKYKPQNVISKSIRLEGDEEITLVPDRLFTLSNNVYNWSGGVDITTQERTITNPEVGYYSLTVSNPDYNGLVIRRDFNLIDDQSCMISTFSRQALIDFYNQTNGPNWTNTLEGSQPWLINDPESKVCDWFGVTVDENFEVTGIELSNNGLSGSYPTALDAMDSLKRLDLSENNIVGAISESLGNLTNLEYLNLNGNRFAAAIPETIGNLQQLMELDLSSNKLTNTIPESLYSISTLKSVKLQNNRLGGPISEAIGDLNQLEVFWVSNNSFSGSIPQTISLENTPNLYSIHLDNNSFSGDLPQLIPDPDLPNTSIKINNNAFIFNDFELEYPLYIAEIDTFMYYPQAFVDQQETIYRQIGDSIKMTSRQLISERNEYQWYKQDNGGQFQSILEAESKDFVINPITSDDFGVYRFIATNTVIDSLALTRRTITLLEYVDTDNDGIPDSEDDDIDGGGCKNEIEIANGTNPLDPDDDICPDLPTGAPITFCDSSDSMTIGQLPIPNNARKVIWYEGLGEYAAALPSDFRLRNSQTLYAEVPNAEQRIAIPIIINEGAPGTIEEGYQQFRIDANARISDLQITGTNITWYSTPTGGTVLDTNTLLPLDTTYYYAAQNGNSCRFEVEVFVGVEDVPAEQTQLFCAATKPTVQNLSALKTEESYQIKWYKSAAGTEQYQDSELLIDGASYYAVQYDDSGESKNRTRVVVVLNSVQPLIVVNAEQTIFVKDGATATVSDLRLDGSNIRWYQSPEALMPLENGDILTNGATYYASQMQSGGGCESIERVAVKVIVDTEKPPILVGCEKFKPQPGSRYVISGWVREQGLEIKETATKSFLEEKQVSDLFLELLNHLVTDFVLNPDPQKRSVPPIYVPDPESRRYDVLVPYLENNTANTFTIYDFSYIKQEVEGFESTVGFKFSFSPKAQGAKADYEYLTPIGFDEDIRFILLNNPSIKLAFTGYGPANTTPFSVLTSFSIVDNRSNKSRPIYNKNVKDFFGGRVSGIRSSTDFKTYVSNPDYKAENYMNTLIEVAYEDKEQNPIDPGSEYKVSFKPKGPVIDGWQRISTDFVVPSDDNIFWMSILLKNTSGDDVNSYFDDIRVHPFDSNMKTFVYDPETQRLQAELDENNYATYYEYDKEGGLIRVKKETERGVFTIQETRSGNSKLNSNTNGN